MNLHRAAVVSWAITPCPDLDTFLEHMTRLVREAHALGADLVVMPECIDLERLNYAPANLPAAEMAAWLAQDLAAVERHIRQLSQAYQLTLVGGTHLVMAEAGPQNHALIGVHGRAYRQPKVTLTQFESVEWGIQPGKGVRPIPTDPPLGVAVCYDIEFPACAETLTEAGSLALAVPAFTETIRGFQRVRWCAQARATERQVFVLHASLVGSLNQEPVPTTYGSSAILTPSVVPFPPAAILAETPMNQEAVAVADLDWESLLAARESDDVRNWHDRRRGDYRLIND